MATWIMHLRLAESFLAEVDGLDPAALAAGSIAPDSGVPDEKGEKFSPPIQTTHFLAKEGSRFRSADLVFYNNYLKNGDPAEVGRERFSLLLGYFLHLVTDNLHNEMIGAPTLERWAAEFAANPQFIEEIRKDWVALDFLYVRDHPDSLFWRVFTGCACPDPGLDFLPRETLRQRVMSIQEYYRRQDAEIQALYDRPFTYLPPDHADRFLEDTHRRLVQVYRRLWVERVDPGDHLSALELHP